MSNLALEHLSRAADLIKPEPKMDGPHYYTVGPVTVKRVHREIEAAFEILEADARRVDRIDVEALAHVLWADENPDVVWDEVPSAQVHYQKRAARLAAMYEAERGSHA